MFDHLSNTRVSSDTPSILTADGDAQTPLSPAPPNATSDRLRWYHMTRKMPKQVQYVDQHLLLPNMTTACPWFSAFNSLPNVYLSNYFSTHTYNLLFTSHLIADNQSRLQILDKFTAGIRIFYAGAQMLVHRLPESALPVLELLYCQSNPDVFLCSNSTVLTFFRRTQVENQIRILKNRNIRIAS